jgi:hypothetical protein
MYLIPVPSPFLGLIGSGDFCMAALSYQRGEWGKHFTTSCPKISIVLHHAQESTEVFDVFCGVIASIACTFLGCGFMPVLVRIYPWYFVSIAQNVNVGGIDFQALFSQPGKN